MTEQSDPQTLRQALEAYYRSVERENSPATLRLYRSILEQMAAALSDGMQLADITPFDLDLVLEAVLDPKHAPATKAKYKRTIRTFFNWCATYGLVPKSPVAFTVNDIYRLSAEDAGMSLEEAIERYMHYLVASDYAVGTVEHYRAYLAQFADLCGAGDTGDLDRAAVERWAVELRKLNYHSTTLADRHSVTRKFLDWLTDIGELAETPYRIKPPKRGRRARRRHGRGLNDDERARLLEAARGSGERDYALLMFLADTGCRVSAACKLRINNLDLNKCTALAIEKYHPDGFTLTFGEDTAEALRAWLVVREERCHTDTMRAPEHVFVTYRSGGKMSRNRVWGICRELGEQVGIERPVFPYALRHSRVMDFVRANVPIHVTQEKFGHASAATTLDWYTTVTADETQRASEELSLLKRRRTRGGTVLRIVRKDTEDVSETS
jgi:site-specific recombinase XerD